MDREVVDVSKISTLKNARAAKIQVFSALLFAISAAIFFLNQKPLPGLLQSMIACIQLSFALRLHWKTKQLSLYIGGTH